MTASAAVNENSHDQPGSVSYEIARAVVVLTEPNGPESEAFRALRAYVMAHHFREGRRALAVCAANRNAGCTFAATNIAVSLSQIGIKTMLIDGNLRAPGVDGLIRPSEMSGGLLQYLRAEEGGLISYMHSDVLPNLSILYAGGASENAQDLLVSPRLQDLLELSMREYGATIIDTPPANASADARWLSSLAGYSLLVARKDRTYLDDLKTLKAQLEEDDVRIIGSVMNEE